MNWSKWTKLKIGKNAPGQIWPLTREITAAAFKKGVVLSSVINQLGQYRLLSLVSMGQSTQLWYGYDEINRKFIAVKMLQEKFARDRTQIASLKWELKVAREFESDNLIKIFDFGYDKKTPYLVLEWFPAPNIKMIINQGYEAYASHLPTLFPLMAEALAALHKKRLVHCDVKPDNFLYDPDEQTLKLLDFALTKKAVSGFGNFFSMRKKPQGTPSYMSGEQILGKPLDERSDVYSLGCAFFELLSGKLPYTGNSLNELLQKHITGAIPSVTARNKNLTPEVVQIVNSLMTKKRDDRPTNCLELADYLRKIRIFKRTPTKTDVS